MRKATEQREAARPPVISTRCPRPMTREEERLFDERLRALRHDIRDAGGFRVWLETRLEQWIDAPTRCPARSIPRRLARR